MRSEKYDRPGISLAETFSTSPLKRLKRIQHNLTKSMISMSSIKFVLFGLIGKTRWTPWPLTGWDMFYFSETAEQNSSKRDWKQDHNVLYKVCVFRSNRKNKISAPDCSETAEQNSTKLDRKTDLNVIWQVCDFRQDRKNKMAARASDWLRDFRLLWNCLTEFNKIWQKDLNVLY